jgi:ribokinase
MGRVLIAGSINMDVVAQTRAHPQPGETVFGHDLHYIPGGKGSNQAVAASRLSEHVSLVGRLGRDPFGEALMTFLQGERLNLEHVGHDPEHPTGVALITVNEASENTIVVVSGSNFRLQPEDVAGIPIGPDDTVVSVFEIPQETIHALFARAKAAGARTILNPAPATPFIEGLLPLVDVVIVNETELAYYAGGAVASDDRNALRAHARNFRASPAQAVIVTLGASGAVCVQGDAVVSVAGAAVDAVDTTGAGDCFTGAMAVALFEGMPLADALRFANTAASLSVQKLGASTSMPTRAEVDEALAAGA